MRLAAFAIVAAVLPSPAPGCGLDLFGVCGGAERVAQEVEHLPDMIRRASEHVLDHIFNDLLPPMIDKITAAAQQLEDRAEPDYEKAINATRNQLEQLAESIVAFAEEYATDTSKEFDQVVDLVEANATELLNVLVEDMDQRVDGLLAGLDFNGRDVLCASQGYIDMLQKEFSSHFQRQDCECVQEVLRINPALAQDCGCTSCFHVGSFYPQCKCDPWDAQFASGWYNQGKHDFLKCHLEKAVNWDHWTVDHLGKHANLCEPTPGSQWNGFVRRWLASARKNSTSNSSSSLDTDVIQ